MARMTPDQAVKFLGIQADGRLSKCPDMPNCVCSQHATDLAHFEEAWRFKGTLDEAKKRLKAACEKLGRATIADDKGSYLRVEFRSALWKFIDDVEFVIAPQEGVIHFRSASRLGYSDLGVNRRRMKKLKALFDGSN